MNNKLFKIIIIFSITFIFSKSELISTEIEFKSDDLEIIQLSENVYQHISYLETESWGKVACNGLIVIDGEEAIIIDTPVDNGSSNKVIGHLLRLGLTIVAIVPTHFHIDCIGGLDVFKTIQIPIYISKITKEILTMRNEFVGYEFITVEDEFNINVGSEKVNLSYLGAGHTKDNIVVYYENEKVLFGGCLVKAIGSSKGNLTDSDIEEWPKTVIKVKQNYPNALIVVPGHGNAGSIELLDYTVKLFEE